MAFLPCGLAHRGGGRAHRHHGEWLVALVVDDSAWYNITPDIGLVETRTGWQLWREQQFGEDTLGQPHTAAAAPAPDGHANVLHYLVARDAADSIPAHLLPHMEPAPAFRWHRHTSAADAGVLPFTTTTLTDWNSLGVRLVSTSGSLQEWEAILPATTGARRFFRLELAAPQ